MNDTPGNPAVSITDMDKSIPNYSLRQLTFYFLRLGTLGFGGPPALVSYMHRDLVETKQWISEEDYREGLALSQLAPGPLAAQLAIYIGYIHYRLVGATIAGVAFVLPSFLMVLLLGLAYVAYGGLPWMQAIFYGIGAAVIGIIAVGTYRLSKKSLGNNTFLWTLFIILAVVTAIYEQEFVSLILLSGFVYWLYKQKPHSATIKTFLFLPFLQISLTTTENQVLKQIAWYFFKAGAFVFGSGLAIVPFLYGGVVKQHQWLTEQQFLDAVAVAMITPGPVVITVGFIGYLVAGFPGAVVAALATFLPCYLFTVIPAPYFKRWGKHSAVKAVVDGITAATIGAIAGAVVVLGKRQIHDWTLAVIAITTAFVLLRFKKFPEPYIIAIAAIIGLTLKLWIK